MANYQEFKDGVMGEAIGNGECVALVVNNSRAYSEYLFPGVTWTDIFAPVAGARQLLGDANSNYFTAVANDHNDPNQLPPQGAVMVFDATPQDGYTNSFENPFGHTGLCDSADSNGYVLLQQNSPYSGAPVNLHAYPWNYRPCLGWLIPVDQTPVPVPPTVQDAPPAPVETVPVPDPVVDPTPLVTPVEPPVVVPAPEPVPEPTPTPIVGPAAPVKVNLLIRALRWLLHFFSISV